MTESKRIQELNQKIRHLKKTGTGGSDFRLLIRLTAWTETQKEWLHLAFLPAYSPDVNPIEHLWRWMKTEYTHNRCWASKMQLKKHLQDVLQKVPAQAESIKSVMKKENERYQEICDFYQVESSTLFTIHA